jgi:hypothetical protein
VEGTSGPFDVALVECQEGEKGIARVGRREPGKMQHLRHHQEHDEAAVSVNGKIAGQVLLSICGRDLVPRGLRGVLHRTVDFVRDSRNAAGKAGAYALRATRRRESLFAFRIA